MENTTPTCDQRDACLDGYGMQLIQENGEFWQNGHMKNAKVLQKPPAAAVTSSTFWLSLGTVTAAATTQEESQAKTLFSGKVHPECWAGSQEGTQPGQMTPSDQKDIPQPMELWSA